MRRLAALAVLSLAVIAWPVAAFAYSPPEFLVGTSATLVPRTSPSTGVELQNLGPNPIYCAFKSTDAVVGKAKKIGPGESWWAGVNWLTPIWCISSAAQVTLGGTIDTEAF